MKHSGNPAARSLEFIKKCGIEIAPAQIELLSAFASLLLEKADRLNITRVSGTEEIWERHFADSLMLLPAADELAAGKSGFRFTDAGAGAGYTGICIKIMRPEWNVALAESAERKCSFINWAIVKLGLKNIQTACIRVGEQPPPFPADLVAERAMGKLEDIMNPCLSAAKPDGYFCAFQSGHDRGELETLAARNNAALYKICEYQLPCDKRTRALILFRNCGGK